MMYRFVLIAIFTFSFVLAGCAPKKPLSWHQAMKLKILDYRKTARSYLTPYFMRAEVPYPPKSLAFLIFKSAKKLELYAKYRHRWHYIRTFPVLAASGGPGPKLLRGDHQVPEGIYKIIGFNPKSRFDLSLRLNYPNTFDKKEAKLDHRFRLGNNIYIHGKNRSIGCIAVGNEAIQQLFPLVYAVGEKNVTVIIAPNDFRVKKPMYGKSSPKWINQLYTDIKYALTNFPEPSSLKFHQSIEVK